MIDQPYYFGCHERPGHYLWMSGMRKAWSTYGTFLRMLETKFDGTLYPHDIAERQGIAALHHLFVGAAAACSVTALAFWDCSVDSRSGCNSVFFLPARLDFGQAIAAAREAFPEVFARLGFEVVEYDPRDDGGES